MRFVSLVSIGLGLLVPLLACSAKALDVGSRTSTSPSGTAQALSLPLVVSVSGRDKALGESVKKGAELAVEVVNAAGGVRGRPLRLDLFDDASDPETTKAHVASLVAKGTPWGVGPLTTPSVLAAKEALLQSLFVSPSAPLVREPDYDDSTAIEPLIVTTLGYFSGSAATATAQFASENVGAVRRCRSLHVVTERGADESLPADKIVGTFKSLALSVTKVEIPRNGTNGELLEAAIRVAQGGPDCEALFLADTLEPYVRGRAPLYAQARAPQLFVFRSMRSSALTSPFWSKPGASTLPEGTFVLAPLFETDEQVPPQAGAFQARFAPRFGDVPDEASASGFDAAMLVALALQRTSDGATAEELRAALAELRSRGRRVVFTDGADLLRAVASGEDVAFRGVTGTMESSGSAYAARDIGLFEKRGSGFVFKKSLSASVLSFE